jgi:hypothetical protein
MRRFRTSWRLFVQSLQIIRQQPRLMLFHVALMHEVLGALNGRAVSVYRGLTFAASRSASGC